jgi:hypothetical protein
MEALNTLGSCLGRHFLYSTMTGVPVHSKIQSNVNLPPPTLLFFFVPRGRFLFVFFSSTRYNLRHKEGKCPPTEWHPECVSGVPPLLAGKQAHADRAGRLAGGKVASRQAKAMV